MARSRQVDRMSGGKGPRLQQQVKVSTKTQPPKTQVQLQPLKAQVQLQPPKTQVQEPVETWPVAYLRNRKDTPAGVQYEVVWKRPEGYTGPESWGPTWEPKPSLKQDGLGYAMQMVDAWVVAGRPEDFLHWARKAVPTLVGANARGTCMFVALQQAVHLLGESSAVPDAEVGELLGRVAQAQG
ncbi:unnamed protein product [Phytophthora fragariaefolia]|uniref:Unnamed protein product n=1 Tax=Phytophthora fragariaefolia TaxID=1490495 RepID=A0A9W6XV81_9STRA|nr:unnamed protein product [Phytophthora fragariaefolia]